MVDRLVDTGTGRQKHALRNKRNTSYVNWFDDFIYFTG